jgi:hypothetical protein
MAGDGILPDWVERSSRDPAYAPARSWLQSVPQQLLTERISRYLDHRSRNSVN